MKFLFFICTLFCLNQAFAFVDPKVGGTVYLLPELKGKVMNREGVLIVYAMKPGDDKSKAVAVFKFTRPNFPQAFVITAKNLLKENSMLIGPLKIYAEYFPVEGGSISFKGSDLKHKVVDLGVKDLTIYLGLK